MRNNMKGKMGEKLQEKYSTGHQHTLHTEKSVVPPKLGTFCIGCR
jgi:hypothetical protein